MLGECFDTVLDSGLFYVLDFDADRARYADSLAAGVSAVAAGAGCASATGARQIGARRITQDEIRASFSATEQRNRCLVEDQAHQGPERQGMARRPYPASAMRCAGPDHDRLRPKMCARASTTFQSTLTPPPRPPPTRPGPVGPVRGRHAGGGHHLR